MHYSLHVYMFHDCMCGNTVLEILMGKGEVWEKKKKEKGRQKKKGNAAGAFWDRDYRGTPRHHMQHGLRKKKTLRCITLYVCICFMTACVETPLSKD